MRLKVLGALSWQPDDQAPDEALAPQLNAWVCAVLATHPGPIGREQLAALLWPDLGDQPAANALRQRLHRLRQTPLSAGIGAPPGSLRWTAASDVADFRRACAEERWAAALELYAGPLLSGVPLALPVLADWLEPARAELHSQYLYTVWQQVKGLRTSGEPSEVVRVLRRAAHLDPDSSDLAGTLARTFLELGDPAQARAALHAHQSHLERELGEALPDDLAALLKQIGLTQVSSAALTAALPEATAWGLPVFLTSFVGRGSEMERLLAALRQPDPSRRWLTLTGPGGIGKTRLAAELARRYLSETRQSVFFCSLAPLRSAAQITEVILHALGEPLEGTVPAPARVIQALNAQGPVLLVFDNFEHLIDAADLLPELLSGCPAVRLLVTSRQRLNFQAETVMRLGSLSAEPSEAEPGRPEPGNSAAPESLAAQLFVERASRADSGFSARGPGDQAAIALIAERCEGVPLAIELAAAWAAEYSPRDILRQLERSWDFLQSDLRDLPGRHRSLRAVFDYAWQALPPRLREVYARLSVFRAPFGVGAARRIAEASAGDLRLLEQRSLLNSSGAGEYTWHESLRDYALEQLGAELSARLERHLDYFVEVAEAAAPLLKSPEQAKHFAALALIYADLRAALGYAVRRSLTLPGLRLAGALHWFWYVRGFREEGLRWLELFLEQAEPQPELQASPARALALRAAGSLARDRDLPEQAAQRYAQALTLYQALGDVAGQADTEHVQGVLSRDLGEYSEARRAFAQALALREVLGDTLGIATTLNDLGILAAYQDDNDTARRHFGRSLELKRQVGDVQGVSYALNNLANVSGDLEEILSLQAESLRLKQQLGDLEGCAVSYVNQGATLLQLSRFPEAAQEFSRAVQAFLRLGKLAPMSPVLGMVAELANRARQPQAALEFAEAALSAETLTRARMLRSEREKAEEQRSAALAAGARLGETSGPMQTPELLNVVNAALGFLELEFGVRPLSRLPE